MAEFLFWESGLILNSLIVLKCFWGFFEKQNSFSNKMTRNALARFFDSDIFHSAYFKNKEEAH